jgi:hypothetical protein
MPPTHHTFHSTISEKLKINADFLKIQTHTPKINATYLLNELLHSLVPMICHNKYSIFMLSSIPQHR